MGAFRSLVNYLKSDGWNVCAVYCLDAHFVSEASKYIAGAFQVGGGGRGWMENGEQGGQLHILSAKLACILQEPNRWVEQGGVMEVDRVGKAGGWKRWSRR